jgi:uncharacterized membrane protein
MAVDAGAPVCLVRAIEASRRCRERASLPYLRCPPQTTAETNPIVKWLLGGNTLVRVRHDRPFHRRRFLLKYAAERDLVPIELRLAAVVAGAIALLVVGWRLRLRRPGYALMLQGGAVGVLYLTVFAHCGSIICCPRALPLPCSSA